MHNNSTVFKGLNLGEKYSEVCIMDQDEQAMQSKPDSLGGKKDLVMIRETASSRRRFLAMTIQDHQDRLRG